jgi:hypothetical protein
MKRDVEFYCKLPYRILWEYSKDTNELNNDGRGVEYFYCWIQEIPFIEAEASNAEEALDTLRIHFRDVVDYMLSEGDAVPLPINDSWEEDASLYDGK